ncbi:hypothetical protein ACFLZ7_04040 [Nanoarchaeota archaeon]
MKSKKGMQLSINFIVILIIAIAVFGFGITFVGKFFEGASQLKENLDADTEKRIESLLNTGEQVAIPINSKTIEIGKSDVFGVGVLNVLGSTQEFKINIVCTSAFGKGNEDLKSLCLNPEEQGWVFNNQVSATIPNNEQEVFPILFQVPQGTKSGTYIFTITVVDESDKIYDVPRKIYVKTN